MASEDPLGLERDVPSHADLAFSAGFHFEYARDGKLVVHSFIVT